jgi:hypothetical protein
MNLTLVESVKHTVLFAFLRLELEEETDGERVELKRTSAMKNPD